MEKVVILLTNPVLKHGQRNQIEDRERNLLLRFLERNLFTECLAQAWREYDNQRIPGKQHPMKKAFKDVAWEMTWQLFERVVGAAVKSKKLSDEDSGDIMDSVKVAKDGGAAVLQFFATTWAPRQLTPEQQTKIEEAKAKRLEEGGEWEEEAEQQWILKLANNAAGGAGYDALYMLFKEGHLEALAQVEVRPDRAPAGSITKRLQAVLAGSSVGKE